MICLHFFLFLFCLGAEVLVTLVKTVGILFVLIFNMYKMNHKGLQFRGHYSGFPQYSCTSVLTVFLK